MVGKFFYGGGILVVAVSAGAFEVGEQAVSDFKLYGPGGNTLLNNLKSALEVDKADISGLEPHLVNDDEEETLSGLEDSENEESFLDLTDSESNSVEYDGGEDNDAEAEDEEDSTEFVSFFEGPSSESAWESGDSGGLENTEEMNYSSLDEQGIFDPYKDSNESENEAFSYLEAETSADEETTENENSDEVTNDDELSGLSFLQFNSKTSIKDHNKLQPLSFNESDAAENDFETAEQTSAEDEMLREAGQDVPSRSSKTPVNSDADRDEPAAGDENPEVLNETNESEANLNDDLNAEGGGSGTQSENLDAEATTPLEPNIEFEEEPVNGPLSTEEQLAQDLQKSYPSIQEQRPHNVERKHMDEDIKMTEILRTTGKGGSPSSSSNSVGFTLLTLTSCTTLALLLAYA